ncbi:MAG: hypothetical protein VKJ64_00260 [Leptolyngbyaceae bacterium]|nr:hypothetical protein [Leptolyngbyaceae bacterium]
MKFLPFLVLPCFLTLGVTPFTSAFTASESTLSESAHSSVTLSASRSSDATARRGSGRREILAQTVVVHTAL